MESWHIYSVAGLLLIGAEAFSPGFIFLPIGIGFLITAVASLFVTSWVWQVLILAVSIVAVYALLKKMNLNLLNKTNDNNSQGSGTDSMIGKEAMVCETINPNKMKGQIKLYGDVWSAKSENGSIIEAGQRVKIVRVDGNKVIVEIGQMDVFK